MVAVVIKSGAPALSDRNLSRLPADIGHSLCLDGPIALFPGWLLKFQAPAADNLHNICVVDLSHASFTQFTLA